MSAERPSQPEPSDEALTAAWTAWRATDRAKMLAALTAAYAVDFVRAGEVRPGAADPDLREIARQAAVAIESWLMMNRVSRDKGFSGAESLFAAVDLLRGALSSGAAEPEP
jgi:hypothetical protein